MLSALRSFPFFAINPAIIAINNTMIFSILELLGGLALFLFGMDYMGDNLKKLSGGQLESILGKLTSNRLKGFLLGFLVTAVKSLWKRIIGHINR